MTTNQINVLSRLTAKSAYLPSSPIEKRTLGVLVKNGFARITKDGGYQRTADGARAVRAAITT